MPSLASMASAGTDAVYASGGIAATYTPSGGAAVSVTVMGPIEVERGAEETGRPTRPPDRGRSMSVRVSEVAAPGKGDTIAIAAGPDAGTWKVSGVESADRIETTVAVRL